MQKRTTSSIRAFTGREVIKTDASNITRKNVIDVLKEALSVHVINAYETNYLYEYYRGNQPILQRKKDIRPEIMNTLVENRANEIVSFKVGYLMGEPIQYVTRGDTAACTESLNLLNDYVLAEDKSVKDKELADWFHICGTSYRMILPSQDDGESPFEIFTLDPRYAFVVYQNDLRERPVMGVKYIIKRDGTAIYSIYTQDRYFEVENDRVTAESVNALGVPMIEYPSNAARLGAFEIVLPLLDAINKVDSNRLDGVEQFVQALMLFHNVKIDKEMFDELRELGAIGYADVDTQTKGEIKYLTSELNQSQTQSLVNHLYESVLTICGMPNRNGGSSTSDTGAAVIMRDGWSAAEARAKDSELLFKKSEKRFLSKVIQICSTLTGMELKPSQIEVRFTRRNYENITEKANVLTMMLGTNKIHPKLAYSHCGMFVDPEMAYTESEAWRKEQEAKIDTGLKSPESNSTDIGQGQQRGNPQEEERNSNP